MPSPIRICVVGSVNLDFIIRTASLPKPGETIVGGEFYTAPGGKGANQALAARRLGADVQLCACVGDDGYADTALANLKEEDVDLSGVARLTGASTGAAFINLSEDGENQIAVASGANGLYAPQHLSPSHADAIIAQLEIPLDTILASVTDNSHFFCLNTAPARPLDRTMIERADLIVMNEVERDFYADRLGDFRGLSAVTLGARGAILVRGAEEITRCAAPTVDPVDTTGAGDCFTSALTLALSEGMEEGAALARACAAGALTTTRLGAQAAIPTRADVDAFMAQSP